MGRHLGLRHGTQWLRAVQPFRGRCRKGRPMHRGRAADRGRGCSRKTPSWPPSSPGGWQSGGRPVRSAGGCAAATRASPSGTPVPRRSTKRSTEAWSPPSRPSRCAPLAPTAIPAGAADPATEHCDSAPLSSRSRSVPRPSRVAARPDTGNLNAVVKPLESAPARPIPGRCSPRLAATPARPYPTIRLARVSISGPATSRAAGGHSQ